MEEIWKDIQGYEGLYQISSFGRVKSFHKWKRASCTEEYILNPTTAENDYANVTLYKNNRRKKFLVHRLVAEAFIPNPGNMPHINHKDENKLNNNVDNLEWCTPLYNNRYGTAKFRAIMTKGKPVEQYMINDQWLATYANISVASELSGVPHKEIYQCAAGRLHSAGGFVWKYL